jgi:hypothetical protein
MSTHFLYFLYIESAKSIVDFNVRIAIISVKKEIFVVIIVSPRDRLLENSNTFLPDFYTCYHFNTAKF